MCDLKAYLKRNDSEDMVLESVNHIRAEAGEVIMKNLFGEEKRMKGEIREVSLSKNRIVIEQRSG